ncbi:MAG TPA: peptidyl-prolyl cis-trans isomerase [Gemmatimonadaceae bacterium]|nr:peptidyl-prolyl cis-trans isomerase [Gemmatimonadaceae bacterium]
MLQQMRGAAKYIWIVIVVAFVGGFLLMETSGLLGRTPLTPTTPVAKVNGREILYTDWQQRVQQATQNQQRAGRSLTQDEIRQIENETLDEMIMQTLLEQEYRRRGITVSDEEIREFARYAPPPFLYNAPDLQTEGRFDPEKYQRLLASPQARQGGLLVALVNYYRSEVPREKLFEQITDGITVTDADLWREWQDQHDTAQVSYVAWRPEADSAAIKAVSESDARAYFDAHKADFERPGRAWLSVLHIPRVVSAADTNAAREKLLKVRAEIVGGAKFEDVARRESQDTVSGQNGGDLGSGTRGRFVPEFETAAYKLKPGEVSGVVQSPFGFHLIKVDSKKGDTLALRHILIRIQQSDSAATAVDREADDLARIAASAEDKTRLDSASKQLKLPLRHVEAIENRPAVVDFKAIPSVSAWAFGGARPGETSELFDDENGYWLARLDSIVPGGAPRFDRVEREIRTTIARERSLEKLAPVAEQFAQRAATLGLDAAAKASNLTVVKTPPFTRLSFVPGLGQYTKPIGAAFGLPVGAVSEPIRDATGIFVMVVDRRQSSDRTAFEKEKVALRRQRLQQLRQQRLQLYMEDLKKSAKIEDRRKDINAAARRQET